MSWLNGWWTCWPIGWEVCHTNQRPETGRLVWKYITNVGQFVREVYQGEQHERSVWSTSMPVCKVCWENLLEVCLSGLSVLLRTTYVLCMKGLSESQLVRGLSVMSVCELWALSQADSQPLTELKGLTQPWWQSHDGVSGRETGCLRQA